MIAVIPAAGLGKRMASVTGGTPKELLPLRGKLLLEWTIAEARDAGLEETVVVASPDKPEVLALAASYGAQTVVQLQPNGLAFAVALAARRLPAAVLLPDAIFYPASPLGRLVKGINRGYDLCVAVERVQDDAVRQYGIVEWSPESGRVSRILEKPGPDDTVSRWAVAARFAISARMASFLQEFVGNYSGEQGELHLTPVINAAIEEGLVALAEPLREEENRQDCGSPEGYSEALQAETR